MTDNDDTADVPNDDRPLGHRLRLVEALISREVATALREGGVGRREWMVLNVLAGEADTPWRAERIQRGGKRLRFLADRGWVEDSDGVWVLTDAGRAEHERLKGVIGGVREKVAGAVSPEDYATMTASLDAIAAALGADDADAEGWGFGSGRGERGPGFLPFGPGFGPFGRHGFGRGFRPGPGVGPGVSPDFGAGGRCGHPHHHGHNGHHGRGERERGSQTAYECGFDAGYTRGRASTSV